MKDELIDSKQLAGLCGIANIQYIYKLFKNDPSFPKPVGRKYSNTKMYWRKADVERWLATATLCSTKKSMQEIAMKRDFLTGRYDSAARQEAHMKKRIKAMRNPGQTVTVHVEGVYL